MTTIYRFLMFRTVWLREPVTLEDVSFAPHPGLQVELSRLEALEQQTIGL